MIKFNFEFTAGILHEERILCVEYVDPDKFYITLLTGTEAPIPNSIGIHLTTKQFTDLTNMFIAAGRSQQIVI